MGLNEVCKLNPDINDLESWLINSEKIRRGWRVRAAWCIECTLRWAVAAWCIECTLRLIHFSIGRFAGFAHFVLFVVQTPTA